MDDANSKIKKPVDKFFNNKLTKELPTKSKWHHPKLNELKEKLSNLLIKRKNLINKKDQKYKTEIEELDKELEVLKKIIIFEQSLNSIKQHNH